MSRQRDRQRVVSLERDADQGRVAAVAPREVERLARGLARDRGQAVAGRCAPGRLPPSSQTAEPRAGRRAGFVRTTADGAANCAAADAGARAPTAAASHDAATRAATHRPSRRISASCAGKSAARSSARPQLEVGEVEPRATRCTRRARPRPRAPPPATRRRAPRPAVSRRSQPDRVPTAEPVEAQRAAVVVVPDLVGGDRDARCSRRPRGRRIVDGGGGGPAAAVGQIEHAAGCGRFPGRTRPRGAARGSSRRISVLGVQRGAAQRRRSPAPWARGRALGRAPRQLLGDLGPVDQRAVGKTEVLLRLPRSRVRFAPAGHAQHPPAQLLRRLERPLARGIQLMRADV